MQTFNDCTNMSICLSFCDTRYELSRTWIVAFCLGEANCYWQFRSLWFVDRHKSVKCRYFRWFIASLVGERYLRNMQEPCVSQGLVDLRESMGGQWETHLEALCQVKATWKSPLSDLRGFLPYCSGLALSILIGHRCWKNCWCSTEKWCVLSWLCPFASFEEKRNTVGQRIPRMSEDRMYTEWNFDTSKWPRCAPWFLYLSFCCSMPRDQRRREDKSDRS